MSRRKHETTFNVALAVRTKLSRTARNMYSEFHDLIRTINVDFRTFVAINVHCNLFFQPFIVSV